MAAAIDAVQADAIDGMMNDTAQQPQLLQQQQLQQQHSRNPFTLPSDEEVFRLRDDEKRERLEQREIRKNQKIWEKGITNNVATSRKLGAMLREAGTGIVGANGAASGKVAPPHAAAGLFKERRQVHDKESMAEFIAKKREMFLVQMSLDTKREEIRKLEEKVIAVQHCPALSGLCTDCAITLSHVIDKCLLLG